MSFWGWLRRKLIKENSSGANLYKYVNWTKCRDNLLSKWMKDNQVSPSLVFKKAVDEGGKEKVNLKINKISIKYGN